uniref:hypothetical protein n=1 Tax=Altererythrobacter segetis TaxID=1104773 RepID=UPI00140E6B2E|nr:hypothetical protein [Altererythrobacter segetis]
MRFAPIFTTSLHLYADSGPLIPQNRLLKDTRLSQTVENLGDRRQGMTDSAGLTPPRYQPAHRDPIGRRLMVELRKLFLAVGRA